MAAPAQSQVQVSSPAELLRAIWAAKGGERIALAPGDDGALVLDAKRDGWAEYGSRVSLVSAAPARPASFSSVNLIGNQNISTRPAWAALRGVMQIVEHCEYGQPY